MNPNQPHIAGLELALQQWNKGGPSAHFAAQLRGLIDQAKAAPAESVAVEAVAVVKENDDGELYLDWLVEGGICALELPGTILLVADRQITDDEGSGEVYPALRHV